MISTRLHGLLDYGVSSVLLFSPWLFGFAEFPGPRITMMAVGTLGLFYSLFTRYELGAVRIIPMPMHIGLDIGSGLFLLAAPWVFEFAEQVSWPHMAFGTLAITVATLTAVMPRRAELALGPR